ncbi:MAG: hypothetical protein C0616_09220 [Desulfuromonas sp.]|nr:MAG: hypothetical protein C0616_09220 [Desulfuromonas sp.]
MYKFLEGCKKIEELASEIYHRLAENDSVSQSLKKVFSQLSSDEKSHARSLDLIFQAAQNDVKHIPLISNESLEKAIELAESLAEISSEKIRSEKMAINLAIKMENEFVKVHANNSLHFENVRLAELFQMLGDEDRRHIATLKSCMDN